MLTYATLAPKATNKRYLCSPFRGTTFANGCKPLSVCSAYIAAQWLVKYLDSAFLF